MDSAKKKHHHGPVWLARHFRGVTWDFSRRLHFALYTYTYRVVYLVAEHCLLTSTVPPQYNLLILKRNSYFYKGCPRPDGPPCTVVTIAWCCRFLFLSLSQYPQVPETPPDTPSPLRRLHVLFIAFAKQFPRRRRRRRRQVAVRGVCNLERRANHSTGPSPLE